VENNGIEIGQIDCLNFKAILGLGILDFGFWILDFGFWILDFGFWILDLAV
jgi:hypothetical protein